MIKCCNTVLKHFPNHVSSLILKSKVLLHQEVKRDPNTLPIQKTDEGDVLVSQEYVSIIAKLHRLGYRRMPKEMYLRWMGTSDNSGKSLKLFVN